MTTIFSVLMKTDMHTYSSVNGTIPELRLISSCTVRNVSTQHSYQFRATHMKRKSVKSQLQRDRSKESHWEGSETKSNHSSSRSLWTALSNTSCDFWGHPVVSQELNLMILMGPF